MNKCSGLSSWASSHKQPSKAFKQKHEVIAGGSFHRARGDDDKEFTKLQDTVLLQMLLNDDDVVTAISTLYGHGQRVWEFT